MFLRKLNGNLIVFLFAPFLNFFFFYNFRIFFFEARPDCELELDWLCYPCEPVPEDNNPPLYPSTRRTPGRLPPGIGSCALLPLGLPLRHGLTLNTICIPTIPTYHALRGYSGEICRLICAMDFGTDRVIWWWWWWFWYLVDKGINRW